MTKLTKLSLAAVMALSTSAYAAGIADNTTVSGQAYVEFLTTDKAGSSKSTDIDLDATFKTKVNDNVTSVITLQADSTTGTAGTNVTADKVNFIYTNGATTAVIGKQGMSSPTTDGEKFIGAKVSYNLGAATVVGVHATDFMTTGEASAAAIIGSAGPVNLEAWLVDISNVSENATLVASTKVANVALSARYATSKFDDGSEDGQTIKVTAATKVGNVSVNATYVNTDSDNAAYVTTSASANTFELSQLNLMDANGDADADVTAYSVGASVPVNGVTLAAVYANYEIGGTSKEEGTETRLRASYSLSSNFKTVATYSMYESTNTAGVAQEDSNSARVDFKYSF